MDDPLIQFQHARIVEFTMRQHLPLMSEFRSGPEVGGLMSYGPNPIEMWRSRCALRRQNIAGSQALPVEQPSKFELVVNPKTARAIGIEIPTSILLRADELIE